MKAILALAGGLAGAAFLSAAAAAPDFDWRLPAGVAPPPVPADNPMSQAKVDLGHRLFYEPALSRNFSMNCGTCHQQHRGFSELLTTHRGVDGSMGKRNAPGLANIAYASPLTWADPTAVSLEAQAPNPIFGAHPVEMGMAGMEAELIRRLNKDECYRRQFAAAFPEENGAISVKTIAKALASFQRTLLSFDSPYDRRRRGEAVAVSEQANRGEALFKEKGCVTCHSGQNFTDYAFHDIGLPPAARDTGLESKTGRRRDANLFRTPSLRNVGETGPFMHDGSIASLSGSIRAHTRDKDGGPAPALSDSDAADLSLFLDTLTDRAFIKGVKFARPANRCTART